MTEYIPEDVDAHRATVKDACFEVRQQAGDFDPDPPWEKDKYFQCFKDCPEYDECPVTVPERRDCKR